jgi:nucleoside phosphorylase
MVRNSRLHEDYEISCSVLAKLITARDDYHERVLLLKDFLTKSRQIRPTMRSKLGLDIVTAFAPEEIKQCMKDFKFSDSVPRPRADVVIVTVLEEELRAAQTAFGIDPQSSEDRSENGLRFWHRNVRNDYSKEDLSVVITMIGKARNVECAIACSRIFQSYEVGLSILIGIAAGLKGKVKFGDVVAADLVLDYEGGRLEPTGFKKRPIPYPLKKSIERDMNYFNPKFRGWYEDFFERLEQLKAREPIPTTAEQWKPDYHRGVILAGEKLLADGSLPQMQTEFHDRVRAAEMEGSGFASVSDEYAIPWLVFRGVSDFGDPEKPDSDIWRTTAVLAAACAAKTFIRSDYRKLSLKF